MSAAEAKETEQPGAAPRALDALRHTNFRRYYLATLTNVVGSMMTPVALAFAVLHVSNRASSLGLVMAAEMGANVLCVMLGGVVADRMNRRVLLQGTRVVNVVVLSIFALTLFTDTATVPLLALLGAATGAASAFAMPASMGIVQQIVPTSLLQQANALMSLTRNGTQLIGPVLGALLVAAGGPAWSFVFDAGLTVVSVLLLLGVRLPPAEASGESMLRDLRAGWSEFSSRTWLWVVVAAASLANAIQVGAMAVLGPTIAKNDPRLGIPGWGWALAAESAGMLLMGLALLRVRITRPLRFGVLGISTVAVPLYFLGADPRPQLLVPLFVISGAGMELFNAGWMLAMMERIPPKVFSRVTSYDMLGSYMALPAGTLIFGWLAAVYSPQQVLQIAGPMFGVVCLATLLARDVRSMGRMTAPAAADGIPQTTP
ncbi:MFS transporter [Calidifontibacter sp. DB0510]|uniref:MFS transporter n=1 Tax=Metallococcus carri TaxID=1656884 RepID=A0A967B2H2_9MICO|nr:MFS transporter [Metallococcus carri]NHN56769.1 MFS transporter [Metallococcus carri]NOP37854.1 MFS transporter [Calidifontibacter sp. DB2511S]